MTSSAPDTPIDDGPAETDPAWIQQEMGERSVLDPSDPLRSDFLPRIIAAGPSAEEEWICHILQHERIRLELLRLHPPEFLTRDLLEIPLTCSSPELQRKSRILFRKRPVALAILSVILLGGVLLLHEFHSATVMTQYLAFAVVEHQSQRHPMTVQTENPAELERLLRGTVNFQFHIPNLSIQGFTLIGARPCRLNGQDIIQTRWRRGPEIYSLYIFHPKDHGLIDSYPRQEVASEHPDSGGTPIVFWSEDSCGYALILDAGASRSNTPDSAARFLSRSSFFPT